MDRNPEPSYRNTVGDEPAYAPEVTPSKLPLAQQEKALYELHEVENLLQKKLSSVLSPVNRDETQASEGERVPERSPLAEQLDSNTRSIRVATEKLRILIDRLEC